MVRFSPDRIVTNIVTIQRFLQKGGACTLYTAPLRIPVIQLNLHFIGSTVARRIIMQSTGLLLVEELHQSDMPYSALRNRAVFPHLEGSYCLL
jgi:hypothetical protein